MCWCGKLSLEKRAYVRVACVELLLNVSGQFLRSNREHLRLFNQLLVRANCLGGHDDVSLLRIDFRVQPGVSNQIDNPSFGVLRSHVQFFGQHPETSQLSKWCSQAYGQGVQSGYLLYANALVDTAEGLENHQPCALNEVIKNGNQEEVVQQNVFALPQLLLGSVEVEVDVQVLDEFSDWISVCVGFLLDNFNQVLHHGPAILLIDDDGCSEIAENVWAHRLDGVQIPKVVNNVLVLSQKILYSENLLILIEQHLDDKITTLRVIEEDE